MTDGRTAIVGAGYDAMADEWERWAAEIADDPRHAWVTALAARLPDGARVLELGCGNGTQETRLLAARFRLTGVDLSEEQLRRARERVPAARFVHADFTSIEFDRGSFDAVVAFYSFNHVPRELLGQLLARIASWLVDGGLFLAALGTGDIDEWVGDWLGATMFFSSFPPEVNSRLLRASGFVLERDEVVTIRESEGDVRFQWVLARR